MESSERKLRNISQSAVGISSIPPSVDSMLDGESVYAITPGNKMRLYLKHGSSLYYTNFLLSSETSVFDTKGTTNLLNLKLTGDLTVDNDADFNGDLDVDGTSNLDNTDIDGTLTQDGGAVVFNEAGADYDFRIESDDDVNAFVVDGGDDRVGIGILAPAVKCHVYFTGATTETLRVENAQGINSHAIQTRSGHSDPTNADGGRVLQACSVNGTQVGLISWSNQATAYGTSSDYRLKENNVTLANGLEKLNNLKPYTFNWIGSSDVSVDGFFAHEVSEIVPQAVQGLKDAVNDDGSVSPQSIDNSHLVPLLVKAVQELSAEVEKLKE